MKTFLVEVLHEESPGVSCWTVSASTPEDAQQLAFALDGGWGDDDKDASEMLALAKMYCLVKEINSPNI